MAVEANHHALAVSVGPPLREQGQDMDTLREIIVESPQLQGSYRPDGVGRVLPAQGLVAIVCEGEEGTAADNRGPLGTHGAF